MPMMRSARLRTVVIAAAACVASSAVPAIASIPGERSWIHELTEGRRPFAQESVAAPDGTAVYLVAYLLGGVRTLALDAATGDEIWRTDRATDGTILADRPTAVGVTPDGSTVVTVAGIPEDDVPFGDRNILVTTYDATTGAPGWTVRVDSGFYYGDDVARAISFSPGSDVLYLVGSSINEGSCLDFVGHTLAAALDMTDGHTRWLVVGTGEHGSGATYEAGSIDAIVTSADGEGLYVGGSLGEPDPCTGHDVDEPFVRAIDAATGITRWTVAGGGGSFSAMAEVPSDGRVVAARTGGVAAFDPTTGERLWRRGLRGTAPATMLVVGEKGHRVYVAGPATDEVARVSAITTEEGTVRWTRTVSLAGSPLFSPNDLALSPGGLHLSADVMDPGGDVDAVVVTLELDDGTRSWTRRRSEPGNERGCCLTVATGLVVSTFVAERSLESGGWDHDIVSIAYGT